MYLLVDAPPAFDRPPTVRSPLDLDMLVIGPITSMFAQK